MASMISGDLVSGGAEEHGRLVIRGLCHVYGAWELLGGVLMSTHILVAYSIFLTWLQHLITSNTPQNANANCLGLSYDKVLIL